MPASMNPSSISTSGAPWRSGRPAATVNSSPGGTAGTGPPLGRLPVNIVSMNGYRGRFWKRPGPTRCTPRNREGCWVRPLRIALLSYRSKPHCGGQGVYVRHLSRELAALGHHVEVFSGQPYPDLDAGRVRPPRPSLPLYGDDTPSRPPRPRDSRDAVAALGVALMGGGVSPEPLPFSMRAPRALLARRD